MVFMSCIFDLPYLEIQTRATLNLYYKGFFLQIQRFSRNIYTVYGLTC